MELNQIEAFVMVAQTGGFSRAATLLYLSQPAVSRRITLLEQELGTLLFERIHNGIVLTASGRAFLPHAQRVLADMRDGIQAVQAVEQQEQGIVTLAIVGTLASTQLTVRLKQFRAAYPQVKLLLRTARSSEVSEKVRSGETYLGLRYFPDSDPRLISQVIDREAVVLACSAQSALSGTISPEDLAGMTWVGFPAVEGASGEPFARMMLHRLHAAGIHEPDLIAIDSLTAQKRLIEADFGIGLVPVSSIQEEITLGTLKILDCPTLQTSVPIVLVQRQDGYLSKAAQALLNMLLSGDA